PNITGVVFISSGSTSNPPVRGNVKFAYLDFTNPVVEPTSEEFDLAFTSTGAIKLDPSVTLKDMMWVGCDLHRRHFTIQHGGGGMRILRSHWRGAFAMSASGGSMPNTCNLFANDGVDPHPINNPAPPNNPLYSGHGAMDDVWGCVSLNGGFARELCT